MTHVCRLQQGVVSLTLLKKSTVERDCGNVSRCASGVGRTGVRYSQCTGRLFGLIYTQNLVVVMVREQGGSYFMTERGKDFIGPLM